MCREDMKLAEKEYPIHHNSTTSRNRQLHRSARFLLHLVVLAISCNTVATYIGWRTLPEVASSMCGKGGFWNERSQHQARNHSTHQYSLKSRPRVTPADEFYARSQRTPMPAIPHVTLPKDNQTLPTDSRVLVIGDVHGCFEELMKFHDKAREEHNGGRDFDLVVLVGDMCQKGPDSSKIVRFVRKTSHWHSVRGNNDQRALELALGDPALVRRRKRNHWMLDDPLSDKDVQYLADLPYSIKVPGSYFGNDEPDTLIVHAGMIPNLDFKDHDVATLINIRDAAPIQCTDDGNRTTAPTKQARWVGKNEAKRMIENAFPASCFGSLVPWASVYEGPPRVVFGHHDKLGLQRYPGDWAIGLDTGAVFGRELTGMILPERTIVSMETEQGCVPGGAPPAASDVKKSARKSVNAAAEQMKAHQDEMKRLQEQDNPQLPTVKQH